MPPPDREAVADAFLVQSRSDWAMFLDLHDRPTVAACHRFHYLQMACEKLAKAYRIRDLSTQLEELTKRHVGFVQFMNAFLGSPSVVAEYATRHAQLRGIRKKMRQLAGEIERLAPAVDAATCPANAEYPWWRDDGVVIAPCDYPYPSMSLREFEWTRFVKLIERAMNDFETIKIH